MNLRGLHGGEIYDKNIDLDFSININPLGMPTNIIEALKLAIPLCESYPDSQSTELKELLADRFHLPKDMFVIGNGAADIIYRLAQALKPRKALLISPTFVEYERALQSIDCDIEFYNLKAENNFMLDEDYIVRLQASSNIDVVFICNPNNPVGKLYPKKYIDFIIELCEEKGIMCIVDESFMDFAVESAKYSVIDRIKTYKNLFILSTLTKMYAIAGIRIGYLMTSNFKLIEKINNVSQPWAVSIFAQKAGVAALKNINWAKDTALYVKTEREWLSTNLSILGYKVYDSDVNYILFQGTNYNDLYEQLLKQRILIRHCNNFRGLNKTFYRIAVRTRNENENLIKCITNSLH
jgi:L-threonine-O-3-phosphate decarboxylase